MCVHSPTFWFYFLPSSLIFFSTIVVYRKLPSRQTVKRKHTTAHTKLPGNQARNQAGNQARNGPLDFAIPSLQSPCVRTREFENPQSDASGKTTPPLRFSARCSARFLVKFRTRSVMFSSTETEKYCVLVCWDREIQCTGLLGQTGAQKL